MKQSGIKRTLMKKFLFASFTMIAITTAFQAHAIQVLPPAGGFKNTQDRDDFYQMNNYNMQQEQQELLRRQVRAQEEMLRLQKQSRSRY